MGVNEFPGKAQSPEQQVGRTSVGTATMLTGGSKLTVPALFPLQGNLSGCHSS